MQVSPWGEGGKCEWLKLPSRRTKEIQHPQTCLSGCCPAVPQAHPDLLPSSELPALLSEVTSAGRAGKLAAVPNLPISQSHKALQKCDVIN